MRTLDISKKGAYTVESVTENNCDVSYTMVKISEVNANASDQSVRRTDDGGRAHAHRLHVCRERVPVRVWRVRSCESSFFFFAQNFFAKKKPSQRLGLLRGLGGKICFPKKRDRDAMASGAR